MGKLKELHELIHGMSSSEKRTFSIDFSHLAQGQPLKLYRALAEENQFEEREFKALLAKKGLLNSLPTLLIRLRKLLVRSLAGQNTEQSVEARLRFALAEIELLFKKKLLDQIPQRIRKARKLAQRFSRHSHELQLIDWERRILLEKQPKRVAKAYQQLSQTEEKILQALLLQKKATDLQIQMRSLSREVLNPKGRKEIERYEALYQHPALDQALESSDFIARAYARNTIGLYQIAMRSWQAALETYTRLMEQWKHHPEWINEQPDLFLANLNNYQISFLYASDKDLNSPNGFTDFFSSHRFDAPKVRLRFETMTYGHKLIMHLNLGLLQASRSLCIEIQAWLTANQKQLSKSSWLAFQHNISVFHFLSGDFSAANRNVQSILNLPDGEQRKDIRNFALLFQLVLQTELGEEDLVEYKFRAVRRQLKGVEDAHPFFGPLLNHFNPRKGGREQNRLTQLQAELEKIEGGTLGLMEVKIWVEGKISGKTVTEIFLNRIAGSKQ